MERTATVEIEEGPSLACAVPHELAIHVGDLCILEADRIPEYGRIVGIGECGECAGAGPAGACHLVRRATLQDQTRAAENALMAKMARRACVEKARQRHLSIRVVRLRYSFDRSLLMVLFSSEEHADVRDLVKDLAGELHVRVDMRQIGVRDEAAIIGGMGPCGRRMCCCVWLRQFESVNVKMAKTQRLSLNPGAISGNCGRLKCCLRYEYEQYRELSRHLPRQGAMVECPEGVGCVIGRDVLGQRLRIVLEGDRIVECAAADIKPTGSRKGTDRNGVDDEDPDSERTESQHAGDEGAGHLWKDDA